MNADFFIVAVKNAVNVKIFSVVDDITSSIRR